MKKNYLKTISQLAAAWACLVLATPGAVAQTGPGASRPAALPTNAKVLISNKIQFHGQVGGAQMNTRFDPLDVCPNVVNPIGHGVQSQPYQFEFESNCSGNSNSWDCRFRPNFIWTIKYFTENGTYYQEKWQDVTSGDFSKVRLYLYDRVPYPAGRFTAATPTSGQATQAGGNANFSTVPYPNLGCIPAPENTAQAGELITNVQLECTGYSCGYTLGDDSDVIQIRYYARRPAAIAINGQTPLCRSTLYPISVSSVFGATNYAWYTAGLNGASIGAVNGTTAMLDVSGVPAGTNSITLSVAAQDNAHCGGITSEARNLVVNLNPSPAASASLQLDGGVCPSATTKFLAAAPVTGASEYRWQLVGSNNPAGTYLVDRFGAQITTPGTTVQTTGFKLEIGTPTAGTVSVMVEAKTTDCDGYSPALAKSFQIGNISPDCPTTYAGPDRWCIGSPNTIYIDTKPGLSYYPINVFGAYAGNIQPAGAQVTNVTQTAAMVGSSEFTITMAPNSAGSYPTSFDLYVSVVSQCPGNTSGSQLCALPVKVTNMVNCAIGCLGCNTERQTQAGGTSPAALYPNPATGEVKIEFRPDTRYPWVKVMDAQGRVVLQRQSEAATGITGFDVKGLPTGLYQVQLFDGKKLTTQPLVKE
ncbi:hypothetical protein GCM10028822_25080 [Hymenobacter terrigena]